jgi:flagellar hook protein FlgE
MSSISSIALSGMQTATARFQSSANNIANPNSGSDLADNIVEQAVAQANVSMSLQMIRADHDMTQALLDILA